MRFICINFVLTWSYSYNYGCFGFHLHLHATLKLCSDVSEYFLPYQSGCSPYKIPIIFVILYGCIDKRISIWLDAMISASIYYYIMPFFLVVSSIILILWLGLHLSNITSIWVAYLNFHNHINLAIVLMIYLCSVGNIRWQTQRTFSPLCAIMELEWLRYFIFSSFHTHTHENTELV